jgi:tRNA pseudouridine synthase 10
LTQAPRYHLCKTCVDRQGGDPQDFELVPNEECFVCGGLMGRFEDVAEQAWRKAKRYEFATFGVGVSMPEGVQEREDEIRSTLQLKGKQTVKSQLSTLLSAKLAGKLKKKQNRTDPDLTILFDVGKSQITLQSRPIFYFGRYTKPAGVAQRKELCKACWGRGCEACGQTGFERTPSVEEKAGRKLVGATGARGAKFTWIGSEDVDSVVCGNGRPFVVELKNPRVRKVPKRFVTRGRGGRVSVTRGRVLPSKPNKLPTFRFRTDIFATAEKRIDKGAIRELAKAFRNATVIFDRPNERPVAKKVYSVRGRVRGRKLMVKAELDGGLPVKRFVSGELVTPSVSELLKTEVKCDRFNICGVKETGEFGFG